MKRNIRLVDQRKRGSGTFVVFWTVEMPDGTTGRFGYDTTVWPPSRAAGVAVRDAVKAIPEHEFTYKHAWDTATQAEQAFKR